MNFAFDNWLRDWGWRLTRRKFERALSRARERILAQKDPCFARLYHRMDHEAGVCLDCGVKMVMRVDHAWTSQYYQAPTEVT